MDILQEFLLGKCSHFSGENYDFKERAVRLLACAGRAVGTGGEIKVPAMGI